MITSLSPPGIEERLVSLHKILPEMMLDTSLDSLSRRIALVCREVVSAQISTLALFNEDGNLEPVMSPGNADRQLSPMDDPSCWDQLLERFNGDRVLIVPSVALDPELGRCFSPPAGLTSLLCALLQAGEKRIGLIIAANKEDGTPFSPQDGRVLEVLAVYAAAALSNAIKLNDLSLSETVLTYKNRNLGLLNDLATGLASSLDIDQILEKTLTRVVEFQHLEAAEVFLRLEDSRTLKLVWRQGEGIEKLWKQAKYKFGEGIIGRAAQSGFPAVYPAGDIDDPTLAVDTLPCFQQLLCFPLTGLRGVWGVLTATSCQVEPFDHQSLRLLSSISMWLGTVIENIRFNLQQRRLAVMEERERIGMDLHDGVIQSIYAVGLTLEHARLLLKDDPRHAGERIEQAITDLNTSIRDIRSYILGLRPRQLLNENLMKGIQRLISEFRINTLIEINLKGSWEDLVDIPEAQAVALFHICQEGLSNIAKHAQAHQVNVQVWTTTDRAFLELHDDGRGFNPNKTKMSLGHGLANMQTRAYNAGGDVEFASTPGEGTRIITWVPFVNEKYTYE